jgi:hypothetical protein
MSDEFPVLLVCKNGHRWKSAEIDAPCLQCKIDELLRFRDDSAKASAALCAERIADRDRLTAENKALAVQLSKVASDNVDLREELTEAIDQAHCITLHANRLAAALRGAIEDLEFYGCGSRRLGELQAALASTGDEK